MPRCSILLESHITAKTIIYMSPTPIITNPLTRECVTVCGNGSAGAAVGSYGSAQFSERGGLCVSRNSCKLYVADTNNHCIKIVDLESKLCLREAAVVESEVKQVKERRVAPRGTAVTQLPPLCMRDGITRNIRLHVELPAGYHFTDGATSCWKIVIPEGCPIKVLGDKSCSISSIQDVCISLSCTSAVHLTESSFKVEAVVYFCEESGLCRVQGAKFQVPVNVLESSEISAGCPIKVLGDKSGSISSIQDVCISLSCTSAVHITESSFEVEAAVYFCEESGLCRVQGAKFQVAVNVLESIEISAGLHDDYQRRLIRILEVL
ncbi:NHL repeat-containing protein 2-like [Corticium candelabrum]|uniref:NHL repeat-containing protein 2-like n=1 Tax=Corticium candelabrum TaxID=121492 RepID=UPI002E255493|nr:NHL repeat-containing protein 2-like [Corticium candelabrum]